MRTAYLVGWRAVGLDQREGVAGRRGGQGVRLRNALTAMLFADIDTKETGAAVPVEVASEAFRSFSLEAPLTPTAAHCCACQDTSRIDGLPADPSISRLTRKPGTLQSHNHKPQIGYCRLQCTISNIEHDSDAKRCNER